MLNSKLFIILKSLTNKELKHFQSILNSGFITLNKDGKALLMYIHKHRKSGKFVKGKFDKIYVQKTIFPNHPDADLQLRRAMSYLKVATEEFLVMLSIKQDELLQEKLLVRALREKGLFKQAGQSLIRLDNKLQKSRYKDDAYHLELSLINEQRYFDPLQEAADQNIQFLKDSMEFLDRFYLSTKLRLSCEIFERQTILGEHFAVPLLEKCIEEEAIINNEQIAHIYSYKKIMLLHLEGFHPTAFKAIFDFFIKKRNSLTDSDQRRIFLYLQNTIIRQYKRGQSNSLALLFNMYKKGIQHKLLLENGMLSNPTFLNVVVTACLAEEFPWIKSFISQEKKRLQKEKSESILKQAWMIYHFYKGNYEKVLTILREIDFPKNYFSFRIKSIKIRTLFELSFKDSNYTEPLEHEIENFYRFLKKSKKSSVQKTDGYHNFLHILKRILGWRKKQKFPFEAKKKLISKINNYQEIPQGDWLITKIEEM